MIDVREISAVFIQPLYLVPRRFRFCMLWSSRFILHAAWLIEWNTKLNLSRASNTGSAKSRDRCTRPTPEFLVVTAEKRRPVSSGSQALELRQETPTLPKLGRKDADLMTTPAYSRRGPDLKIDISNRGHCSTHWRKLAVFDSSSLACNPFFANLFSEGRLFPPL